MKEIVIKLSDVMYERLIESKGMSVCAFMSFAEAVKNGTPLPKRHGRLIDADSLLEQGSCPNDCNGTTTCAESYEHLHCPIRVFDIESINDTPTIIEADKGEDVI